MTIDDLKLDDEFKRLCPALKPDELRQLRDNIIRDGRFLDSIKHWRGVVVDGHNRYDVWFHGELPDGIAAPRLEELEFGTRDEALNWIILHQLGRRNLPPNEAAYLRGKLVQQKSAAPKKDANSSGKTDDPNFRQSAGNSPGRPENPTRQAAQQVASATGVAERTAMRDTDYAAAIDAIGAVNAKAAADIKSGALRVAKKDVLAIAASGNIGAALGNLRNGLAWDHETKAPSIVKDAIGRAVPKHLTEKHAAAAEIQSAATKLDAVKRSVAALAGEPGADFLPVSEIGEAVKALKGKISQARYWTECPRCKGKPKPTCDRCEGHGYLPFSRRGTLAQEDKDWLGVK